jgi:hypothetical protein
VRVLKAFNLIVALLFLCAMGRAQTQANAIQFIDSVNQGVNSGGCSTGCINYPENLAANDVIVACAASQDVATCGHGGSDPNWTFADTLANTWTTQTGSHVNNMWIQMACMKVVNTGADQMTVNIPNSGFCGTSFIAARFTNASCNLDGSIQNVTSGTGTTNPISFNTSTTTTVNGSRLISCGVPVVGPQGSVKPDGGNAQYVSYDGQGNFGIGDALMTNVPTTNIGTYTSGMAIHFGNSTQQAFMQTLALKPATTIAIGTTVFPDAANGVLYSAQLTCVGGILAPTYSLFAGSLPTGVTLNTANGLVSGTPSVTGPFTPQFKCTDGTNTSAAQSLPFTVGTTFNTPNLRSFATFSANSSSGGTTTVAATCGDFIAVVVRGDDTHGGTGWMQATSGTNNFWNDSFGSAKTRFVTNAGTLGYPLAVYLFGPVTQSGVDTISWKNTSGASSGLPPALLLDISGVQGVVDAGTLITQSFASNGSFAQSLATVVPNELLFAFSAVNNAAGTISYAAPFSLLTSGNDSIASAAAFADTPVATATSTTATATFTGSPNVDNGTTLMMALRPGLSLAVCNNFVGLGEKIRRQIW